MRGSSSTAIAVRALLSFIQSRGYIVAFPSSGLPASSACQDHHFPPFLSKQFLENTTRERMANRRKRIEEERAAVGETVPSERTRNRDFAPH